jgi:hypothetical protein
MQILFLKVILAITMLDFPIMKQSALEHYMCQLDIFRVTIQITKTLQALISSNINETLLIIDGFPTEPHSGNINFTVPSLTSQRAHLAPSLAYGQYIQYTWCDATKYEVQLMITVSTNIQNTFLIIRYAYSHKTYEQLIRFVRFRYQVPIRIID